MTRSLAILAAICCLITASLGAQDQAVARTAKPPESRPTPRTANGQVDFSGIWGADRRFIYDINDALKPGEELPIQPWALKVTLERLSKDDPEALCLPTGVPRQAPYPWRILQTPTHMFFLRLLLDPTPEVMDFFHDASVWFRKDVYLLQRARPEISFEDACWRYLAIIGLTHLSDFDGMRLRAWSDGRCNPDDRNLVFDLIVDSAMAILMMPPRTSQG